jgi:hypothetical protein
MRLRRCARAASWKAISGLILVVVTVLVPFSASQERGAAFASPITALADISGETVAKLIDQLGSASFDTRQNAQKELIADAGESLENLRLVRMLVQSIGLQSSDLEIKTRSAVILAELVKLGGLSISIDDGGDTIKITSDGDATTFSGETDNVVEIARILDPFFQTFVGPTKTVYLIEPGETPDENGLTRYSDSIGFSFLGVDNGVNIMGLLFNSDGTDETLRSSVSCSLADVVCIPETGKPQDVAKQIFGDKSGFLVINVISDVPEPSTMLMLGTGLGALLLLRRRRWP